MLVLAQVMQRLEVVPEVTGALDQFEGCISEVLYQDKFYIFKLYTNYIILYLYMI